MDSTPNSHLSLSCLSPLTTQISLAVPFLAPSYPLQKVAANSSFPALPFHSGIPCPQEPRTTVCSLKSLPSSLTLLKLKRLLIPCATTLCPASSALLPTLDLTSCVLPLSNTVCSVYVGKRLEVRKSGVAAVKIFKSKRERSKSWCQHRCQTS